jgi:subtilisin-like proprotein convertase family protein
MVFKKTLIASAIVLIGSLPAIANAYAQEFPIYGDDPLVDQQWHLKNTGQTAFSKTGGVAGNDLDIDFAHAMGIKGRGITVSVIDTGLEIDHRDLAPNVVPGSINFLEGDVDYPVDNHGHGTAVGGLIAAEDNNKIGGRGVAPDANLIGFNYLFAQDDTNWLLSHGVSADWRSLDRFTDPRVFNQSYGWTPNSPLIHDYAADPSLEMNDTVMQDVSLNSHWGRGAIYVKSAGNSFQRYTTELLDTKYQVLPRENDRFYDNNGLPFHNSNVTHGNTNFWNLVVSATDAKGKVASYSSVGSNIFFAAPAGEFGNDAPAMVTTDLSGCESGSNVTGNTRNGLHGGNDLDPTCDYQGTMNGTSSAAPNTAGAIAVVMSANPGLSARTVRHLLAQTARKTDPDNSGVDLSFENSNGEMVTYNAIPGWQTNAAGFNFHQYYGLGAVNVDGAVNKALFTSASLPELQITDWQQTVANVTVPDASVVGVETKTTTTDDVIIEAVQVKLNLDHQRTRDLSIELISPSGTRSVLMSARTGFLSIEGTGYKDSMLMSTHFYGESSKGEWKLKVIDTDKGDSATILWDFGTNIYRVNHNNNLELGVVKDWSIRFYGHK